MHTDERLKETEFFLLNPTIYKYILAALEKKKKKKQVLATSCALTLLDWGQFALN